MQTDIDRAVAAAPRRPSRLSYYHELDPTLYSVTSNTFIGQVYGLFGLVNIADGAEEGNDYPQLNAEYIVSSNPDLIFLADTKCCGESPETVAAATGLGCHRRGAERQRHRHRRRHRLALGTASRRLRRRPSPTPSPRCRRP